MKVLKSVKTLVYWWYTALRYIYIYLNITSRQYFFTIIQYKAIILEIQIDDTFLKEWMRFSPGVHQIPPILGVFKQSKLSILRIVGKLCAFWVHTKFWTMKFCKTWCFGHVLCVFRVVTWEESCSGIFKWIEKNRKFTTFYTNFFLEKLLIWGVSEN